MSDNITTGFSNDKCVSLDHENQIDTSDNSNTCNKSKTSKPILRNPELAIHDFQHLPYGTTIYKVLISTGIGTQYIWQTKTGFKNTELLEKFQERVRKDFGYSLDIENNSPNDYNHRPRRSTKLRAMIRLTTCKAYGTELDSSDDDEEIQKSKRKKKQPSSKKSIINNNNNNKK